MASTQWHGDGRAGATLLPDPHDCRVTLMAFVPFVVDGWVPPAHPGPVPDVPAPGDLRLWPYAEPLRARLRDRLPHRAARLGVGDGGALVDIWSFGIGHTTFVDVHTPGPATGWDELREDVARERSRESLLARAASITTGITAARVGEPLWAQRMLLVETPPGTGVDTMERIGRTLSPDGEPLEGTAGPAGASIRLGVEACVVTQRSETSTWDALARVIAAQTAIWAAVLDVDFQLAAMLDRDPRKLSLHELEERSTHLLTVYERVQRFRAEIEMIPLHLTGLDQEIWNRVNDVWRLNEQLSSLDTSLAVCEHVHTHTATSLTTRQGRFLNGVVLAVTMLSLATFGLTVWDFTQKNFDAFHWVSMVVVVASVVVSVVLFQRVWSRATGRHLRRRSHPDP